MHTLLGSCVAITVWHPKLRIGGMCHYMLPTRGKISTNDDGRYADEVMTLFMREIALHKTKSQEYQVKLFGGGNMFPQHKKIAAVDVSRRNIEAGRTLLQQYGFSVQAENVGGDGHRKVLFEVWSGNVWVKQVQHSQLAGAYGN